MYSESMFIALVIQYAKPMRHIVNYGLFGYSVSRESTIFCKNVIELKTCVFNFSKIFSETCITIRRTEPDVIIQVLGLQFSR